VVNDKKRGVRVRVSPSEDGPVLEMHARNQDSMPQAPGSLVDNYIGRLRQVAAPIIKNQSDLTRYVRSRTTGCVGLALCVDVVNQLTFFEGWAAAIRSWSITVLVAWVIAYAMLSFVGRANLRLHEATVEFELLSRTDPLTGLPNRRALLNEAERITATLIVLVIFDIDHFKQVNDTFGHRAGDVVLQIVGRTIASELDSFGMVGRIGGEEFVLVCRDSAPAALVSALHRLRDRLANTPIVAAGQAVTVTISAGAAIRNDEPLDTLYAKADQALYRAKATGRNRVCLSSELEALLNTPSLSPPFKSLPAHPTNACFPNI
jgi:diguanylate cyclase (GGDEF)-like protein